MKPDIRFQGWKEEGDSWDRGVKRRPAPACSHQAAAGEQVVLGDPRKALMHTSAPEQGRRRKQVSF